MTLTIQVPRIIEESTDPLLQLHPSWERVPLQEIAEILNGFAFSSRDFHQSEGIPILRIRDIGKSRTECFYNGTYDPKYFVEKGDLLVGMDGNFNCARWIGPRALLNQRVCKLTITSSCYEPRFLDIVLPGYLKAINERTSSQTVKHLSSKSVAEIPLPLPPLPEQHRIVAKTEELFTKLHAGVALLRHARKQLDPYRHTVLNSAMRGGLTQKWRDRHRDESGTASSPLHQIEEEQRGSWQPRKRLSPLDAEELRPLPEEWTWTRLEQIAERLQSGGTPSTKVSKFYENGTIPFVKIEDMADSGKFLRRTQTHITESGLNNSSAWLVPENSLLYSMYASYGIPVINEVKVATNQAIIVMLPDSDLVSLDYAYYFLLSIRPFLETRGTTQRNLNAAIVRSLPVPLAPLPEQEKIVEEIETRLSIVEHVAANIDANLKSAEQIRQSILKQVFSGKLVPQDPSDESAGVLLQRIREAREGQKSENSRASRSQAKIDAYQMS